jgi:hypothetical protein
MVNKYIISQICRNLGGTQVPIFKIDPENGGGKQLRNVCTVLPDYTASYNFIAIAERTSNLTPTTDAYNDKVQLGRNGSIAARKSLAR